MLFASQPLLAAENPTKAVSRGVILTALLLAFVLPQQTLLAQELQTTYKLWQQPPVFYSLGQAEMYMRNVLDKPGQPGIYDPTAKLIPYVGTQYNLSDLYHYYHFADADIAAELPGYVAYQGQGDPCPGECPITGPFGNDFCETSNYPICSSLQSHIDYFIGLWSKPGCTAELLSQGPWYIVGNPAYGWNQFQPSPAEIQATGWRSYASVHTFRSYLYGCSSPSNADITFYGLPSAYCPEGYVTMFGPGTCRNELNGKIYEYGPPTAEPVNSCPAGNPCHPASGNKSQIENDFEHPTLPFSRGYHSLTPYPDYAAMGRGWTHSYSQRLLDDVTRSVPAKKLLDGEGNIEIFDCTDNPACTVYRSVNQAGHILLPISGGWLYRSPGGEQKTFDDEGKLESIERLSGNYVYLTIAYTSEDKVDSVTDQFGRQLSFTYNADGLVESITLPSGELISYTYVHPDGPGAVDHERQNLVTVTRQDNQQRQYHYEDTNVYLLTGITDENNIRYATYAYDSRSRVISSQHAGGAGLITLNYTNRPGDGFTWSITEVTEPLGEIATYDMEAGPFRKVTDIEDSRGSVAMSYDPTTSWRSSKTDREGHQTTYVYGDGLHETSRTEAVGSADARTIETDWNSSVNRISEIRQPGSKTNYSYNTRGQVLSKTITDTATLASRSWTYTYFEPPSLGPLIGQVETVNGPRTDVSDLTTYDYYTTDDPGGAYLSGDLKSVTNALGHRTDYLQYDSNGRPLQITDANNVLTVLTYHARGWIASRTLDGKTTAFSYDDAGNLTRVTQPDGSYIAYEYDDAHRMDAIEDNFGNRIEYTLDAAGNRTAEKTYDELAVLRRQMSRVYDQLDRLESLIDGNNDATDYGYDDNGNRTSTLDPNLNTTSFEYDALDRLKKTIDANLGETVMGYDARDNLVSVTDPLNNLTQYTYDGLDDQTQLDSPDSGVTSYEYDDAGNRTAAIDARAVRVDYAYDALNRLTDVTYPDSSLDVSFTYDTGTYGKGRLTQMTDAVGTVDYTYDARGNLLSEIRTIGIDQYVTAYAYNNADRLIQITYPSGMVIDYSLDGAGRITAVDKTVDSVTEPLASNVQYEPFGPVTTFTYGNGLTYSATYDQDYELDQLQAGSNLDWVFGHDPVGNILSIDDQIDNNLDQTLTYDDLYRLDTAQGIYGSEDFDYDANGNRTRYQNGVTVDGYSYLPPQSNRLYTQGGWVFARDAAGNRTIKTNNLDYSETYTYSDQNRLVTFTKAAEVIIIMAPISDEVTDYAYDGRGQRVSKTDHVGNTTHYLYGLSGELLGEYGNNGNGPTVKEYVYLNGQPLAVYENRMDTYVPPPSFMVIDNDDPESSSSGTWSLQTDPQQYGSDYREAKKNASNTYRWTLSMPIGIDSDVYAWWVDNNGYTAQAEYTISYQNGTQTDVVVKSQKTGGGQWNYLGTYFFEGGPNDYIEVGAANGKTSADAIRFQAPSDPILVSIDETRFIHTGHLGTPRAVSDDSQTVIWRWDSAPFGDSAPNEDPDGDSNIFTLNLRFPGQYYDVESALYYNNFRTYDPEIGRYLESDLVGLGDGTNTFAYVQSNPLGFVDGLGLKRYGFQMTIGGGLGYVRIISGGVWTANIYDYEEKKTCTYSVVCAGLGVGTPEVNGIGFGFEFEAGNDCQSCDQFEGYGYIGGIFAGAMIGGVQIGGGIKIPGVPLVPNRLSENIGYSGLVVSHSLCHFYLR